MKRYTVIWVQSAEDELMEIWLAATGKAAVTSAADALDQKLSADASTLGVDVAEGLRGAFLHPIKILFTVSEEDRMVEVLRVLGM